MAITDIAVIVMGVSGSGKSTVAAALAERLGSTYLEGDEYHLPESIAKMKTGIPLNDEDRWPWFDRLAEDMNQAIESDGLVIASCSALKRKYRDRLREKVCVKVLFVHLQATTGSLEQRIASRGAHYMPISLLQSQLQSLELPDADECALLLTNEGNLADVIDRAHAWLERRL